MFSFMNRVRGYGGRDNNKFVLNLYFINFNYIIRLVSFDYLKRFITEDPDNITP